MEEADQLTGFVRGRQSWAFAGLLALAERGLYVHTIDSFDPEAFAAGPREEIARWFPDAPERRQELYEETDIEREGALVAEGLRHPRIWFESRAPTWDEMARASRDAGAVVIARLNHRPLVGRSGYYGHSLLVDGVDDDGVRVQDPGPPAREDHHYDRETFRRAWQGEEEGSGELIVVSTNRPSDFPSAA